MSTNMLTFHEARVRRFDEVSRVATVVIPGPFGMTPIDCQPFVRQEPRLAFVQALNVGDRVLVMMHENEAPEWISVYADWFTEGNISLKGNIILDPGVLIFGSVWGQVINLWDVTYAIGVQIDAVYNRSPSAFVWFKGGTHSDTFLDPGLDGIQQMRLGADGRLTLPANVGTAEKIRIYGTTASETPMMSFYSSLGVRQGYLQASPTTFNIVSDLGDINLNSGGGQVRTSDAIYVSGASRIYAPSSALDLIGAADNNYLALYPNGTNVDTRGTRGGYVGFPNSATMFVRSEVGPLRIHSKTNPLDFYVQDVYAARFNSAGDFMVNKTAVDSTTAGVAVTAGGRVYTTTATATQYNILANIISGDAGDIFCHWRKSDSAIGSITIRTDTVGVLYNQTSHGPFKDNVEDLDDDEAIERLLRWRPVSFQWKFDESGDLSEEGEPQGEVAHGFIAQELNEIQPSAVAPGHGEWSEHVAWRAARRAYAEANERHEEWFRNEDKDRGEEPELPDDPGEISPFEPWQMDNSALVPDMVAAMQALVRQVQAQTKMIRAQGEQIRALQATVPGPKD